MKKAAGQCIRSKTDSCIFAILGAGCHCLLDLDYPRFAVNMRF